MQKFIIILGLISSSINSSPEKGANLFVRVKPEVILREAPTAKSKAIARIPFGYLVLYRQSSQKSDKLLGQEGVWYEVQNGYNNSQKGWIFAPLLRESKEAPVLVIRDGKVEPETVQIDEVYFDKSTRLYWTSCNAEQTYDSGQCKGASYQDFSVEEGEKYCQQLKIGGLKWLLPDLAELRTIANKKFSAIFPYSELGYYVSSTMGTDGREDYYLSIQIPNRLEHSVYPQGSGMIKCFARKK